MSNLPFEGTPEEVLGSLPIHFQGTGPFLSIINEYAAIVTPGFEILLTQEQSRAKTGKKADRRAYALKY
ncbi:MAG: hypothetical protein FWG97_04500 [Deltaproteobacteria bacterium]|nr:hypothetical protein [Deltaproteobacteria bacterium]